ncbi:SDR family NAD(P)-dependent oxidoreductase [Kribbella solani]|uniref:SDR family NAD(P)-dependent oxidoreductase n=1 Tax=Kribbella solani TaxID=236067 RepID=UPI0029A29E03|nr:SDR family NAD(P)-dependent oxidoreductase [Kribbella solani]MDX2968628.1 SDR family NAD(P)-dependent oxidoreductase [Kribbella solani]MDX3006630.1 SDR family NAD(P)-dependent oxidoreductase [Kribbella solani]
MTLTGQRVLVTGGTRGIGRAIAEAFLGRGCEVVTVDVDPADTTWSHYRFDLADTARIADLVSVIEQEEGPLDVLINCAAIPSRVPFTDLGIDHFDQVMSVNLKAAVFLVQAVARGMADRGYGRIVNITSIHGARGERDCLVYDMSKAALGALTRTLGIELAGSGILVTAVAPGFIDTRGADLTTDSFTTVYQQFGKLPLGRAGRPEEVAEQVVWLASPQNSYVTGTALAVDGGLSATF